MDVAMIGLGRMGANMARRLLRGGHRVVVWNRTFEKAQELESEGAEALRELTDVPKALTAPRVLWFMLPHGQTTEDAIDEVVPLLQAGDVIIDGGNSMFAEDIRRADRLAPHGLRYLDVGTSGGIWGLENGYCMMAGGDRGAFEFVEPILRTLGPEGHGYDYMGTAGSGHFVKMVHNGIEYAMLQSYAEGFEILSASQWELDMQKIADLWNHASVVRSWLLELAVDAFGKDPKLEAIKGWVDDTGEGRWTLQAAIDTAVPAPAIAMALFMRFRSRQDDSYGAKVIAALRNEFGGHAVKER